MPIRTTANGRELDSPLADAPATLANAERYRAIADSAFDLIAELDTQGRFFYLSPNYTVTTGIEPDKLLGSYFFDTAHPDDRATLVAEFTAALAGARVGRTEHRLHHGSGDWRWFESALRGVGQGPDRRVVMISREITARLRHQLELESLIELAKAVHAETELSGILRATRVSLGQLLPCDRLLIAWQVEDGLHLIGESSDGAFSGGLRREERPSSPLWPALGSGTIRLENMWTGEGYGSDFELRSFVALPLRNGDWRGTFFFAAARPFVWTEDHVRLCTMVGEQVSVAVRGVGLLAAARSTEEKYRALINDVDAVVWKADFISGQVTFVSPQIEAWFGYPAHRWLGAFSGLLEFIHPADHGRVLATCRAHMADVDPWQLEFRALSRDRRELWLRVLVTPEVHSGVVLGARGLLIDVTERSRHLEAILESNAVLKATQEASADGICVVDERGTVVSLNQRFAEMFHIAPSLVDHLKERREVLGVVLAQMSEPDEFIERINLLRDAPATSSHDEIQIRDGRILERFSAPALAPDGRSFGRVWTFSDITERKRYEEQLAHQAFHDALTDLPNRTLFMDRAEHALSRLDRGECCLAVLFIDLDRFKVVNDTMGHERGDWLLREFALRLQASLRPGDTAARFGGDEFVVLLEDLHDLDDARHVTERLIEILTQPFKLEGREFEVTASMGVALAEKGETRASDLLRHADIAMYRAKNKGKARYEVFDTQMSVIALEKLQLEVELRQAVKWKQLRLAYQPLVDLSTDRVLGMEALVRWQHPELGIISPNDFIPIAEESGMIMSIGGWVLREACRQARVWQQQFPDHPDLKISVNLSARQFQGDIVAEVAAALAEADLQPHCLELEITESAVMEDAEATVKTLEELKKLGVKLAIDDFGTGYSSLAYIERFPLDVLKIDRSFVAQIGKHATTSESEPVTIEEWRPADPAPSEVPLVSSPPGGGTAVAVRPAPSRVRGDRSVIMQAVQTLGQGLGIAITAEGIETPEQLAELREMGCAVGQGFYFARPLDCEQFEKLLLGKPSVN